MPECSGATSVCHLRTGVCLWEQLCRTCACNKMKAFLVLSAFQTSSFPLLDCLLQGSIAPGMVNTIIV
eukprot:1159519-Pelagomonas_calceolata.AAC.5